MSRDFIISIVGLLILGCSTIGVGMLGVALWQNHLSTTTLLISGGIALLCLLTIIALGFIIF